MQILVSVLVVLAVNALPFWGAFGWNLDPAQLLVLFWVENVAATVLISLRIWIHRSLTRKRGHWNVKWTSTVTVDGEKRASKSSKGSALMAFLLPSASFTAAHGILVYLLSGMLKPEGADPELFSSQVKLASQGLLIAMSFGFLSDLVGISRRPFAWIRQISEYALGRVVGIHLLLVFGMFGMGALGLDSKWVLGALLALKLLTDLSNLFPPLRGQETPPSWLGFMRYFDKPGKESFDDYWRREHRLEARQLAKDEEVREPRRRR